MTFPDAPHAEAQAGGVETSCADPTRPLSMTAVSMTFADGTEALHDVSLELQNRELVAVVGPSGCGKTTLLRLAAGLARPTAGSVSTASACSFVFQDPALLEWRTARANVELVSELQRAPRDERRRRATEALAQVGLEGFEHHHPRHLSGGMRMRVSLARTLITEAELILFDEPFGTLDEITRLEMQTELQWLFHGRGLAGLLVTHSVAEATYLAHRVVVMSGRPGHIVTELPVPFDHPRGPALRHTAEFGAFTGEVSAALSAGRDAPR